MVFDSNPIIESDNLEELQQYIEVSRSRIKKNADKSLLTYTGFKSNLGELEHIPDGYSIIDNNVPIDVFFHQGNPNQSTLYVILNGARTSSIPEFKRWTYYQMLPGSVLNIADPMYRKFPSIGLGWYYGTSEENYREYIKEVILKVKSITKSNEIIFIASSGGGSPAIHVAHMIGNCKVVVINPQLNISLYKYKPIFERKMGLLFKDDKFNRVDVTDYIDDSIKVLYVVNICSKTDCIQLDYLIKKRNLSYKYGLLKDKNLIIWTYDAPGKTPHNNQEFYPIFYPILKLINNFDNELDYYSYWIFTEYWHHYYTKTVDKSHSSGEDLITYINNGNKIITNCTKTLKKSKYKYTHIKAITDMKNNTLYSIIINSITSSEPINGLKAILKNTQDNHNIKTMILNNDNNAVQFLTKNNADLLELRLYPPTAGRPNDIEITVNYSLESIGLQK